MNWNLLRLLGVGVVILSAAAHGFALDMVETRDGQRLVGTVSLEAQGAVVCSEDGSETKVAWDQIKEMARDRVHKAEARGTGTGLKAEFFGDWDGKDFKTVRIDPNVDMESSGREPAAAAWRDRGFFGARWTGRIEPRYTEAYRFFAASGERHIRVWVKGKLVVDQWHNDPERMGTIDLKAGEKIDVRVDMEQAWGASYARVYWESTSQPREIIPADRCYLPDGFGAGDVEKHLLARAEKGAVKAEIFEDDSLTKLKRVELQRPVDWHGFSRPEPGVLTGKTSVRWTFYFAPPQTDPYTFSAEGDWGRPTRLWLNGKMITENWSDVGDTVERGKQHEKHHAKVDLEAGKRYEMKFETMRFGAGSVARVDLCSPHTNWRPVQPDECLVPDDMPRVAVVEPYGETVVKGDASVELRAVVGLPAAVKGSVKKVEFYQADKLVGSAEKEPYVLKLDRPAPEVNVIVAKVIMDTGVEARSQAVQFWATVPADKLGQGWLDWGVGAGGGPMAIEKDGDKFIFTGGAGNLAGSDDDSLRFVHRQLEGDGEIVAKIDEVAGKKDAQAIAGISLRDSLATGAHGVSLVIASKGGTAQAMVVPRRLDGPPGGPLDVPLTLPCWVKLTRMGDRIRAYWGHDGQKWERAGEWRVDWATRSMAGLVVVGMGEGDTSGNHALLEQVKVHEGALAMAATREGVIMRTGSFLAGEIVSADGQTVIMKRNGAEKKYASADVSMVAFGPMSAVMAETIGSGKVGVVLAGGDFFDGDLESFKNRRTTVVSVLFGSKMFETWELRAIVLHDGVTRKANWVAELADGSHLLAKTIKALDGKIAVEDIGGESVTVEATAVKRLTAGN